MASDNPDDVRLYSIFDRPEGEIAQMGKISVSIQFDQDQTSAFNGWALIQRSRPGRANMANYDLRPIFEKTLRAELMEMAKKSAKELHANAILDLNELNVNEGCSAWKCRCPCSEVSEERVEFRGVSTPGKEDETSRSSTQKVRTSEEQIKANKIYLSI